jgi:hypothetical protein
VVREALASAARGKYPGVVAEAIGQLGNHAIRAAARQALAQYGEMAVKALRNTLFDDRTARDIRFNIPRTLSKIHSQSAMNAILGGLLEEDRSLRFQSILALEEMARRFPNLRVDREIIENAIVSDVMRYAQRFAIFFVLFTDAGPSSVGGSSLLRQALLESIERVSNRTSWLLSLIYPSKDIRRIWGALKYGDSAKKAYAVELLDNLLTGDVKRYIFPFYGDTLEPERFRLSLEFLGWASLDANTALRMLLDQEDIWLTAATVWEIGRGTFDGNHVNIARFLESEHLVLREVAEIASEGFELAGKDKKLSTIEKVVFLKTVDIFAHVTVEQLGRIAGLTDEVRFEPEEPIIHEGDPIDAVYLLLKGRVALEKNGQKAREIGAGNAFGTVGALDFNPAIHTIKAMDHVHALKLDARDLHDLLSQDIELVEGIIRVLCQKVRAAQ